MYVKGVRSGTLCRVYLRGPRGERVPAGTFTYRWGDDSEAVLSSALDLSRTRAIGVRAGNRTFVAPVDVVRGDGKGQLEPGGRDVTRTKTTYAMALLALAAALAIAGCGSSSDSSSGGAYGGKGGTGTEAETVKSPPGAESGVAVLTVASAPKVGPILVDAKGFTVYDFHKDKGTVSSCYGGCARGLAAGPDRRRPHGRRRRERLPSSARPSAKTAPSRSPTPATRSTPMPPTRNRAKPTATTSPPSAPSGTPSRATARRPGS